jgi:hypothetical protein
MLANATIMFMPSVPVQSAPWRDFDTDVYVTAGEVPPMTFQIGMVANDGWLIASDQKETLLGFSTSATRVGAGGQKIRFDADKGIAFAAWGEQWMFKLGQSLIENFSPSWRSDSDTFWSALTGEAKSAWKREKELRSNLNEDWSLRGLMVGIAGAPKALWTVDVGEQIYISPRPDFMPTGDVCNAAMFFPQRYYKRLSVDQLKLLAAHTVLLAHDFNTAGVGGLEMLVCKDDKFNFLKEDEIATLRELSEQIDSSWRAIMTGAH